jgi:hypothetical protein
MKAIRCACGDTDGPFERRPDGSYRCEGCIKTGGAS